MFGASSQRLSSLWVLLVVISSALAGACQRDPKIARKEYFDSGNRFFAEGKLSEAIVQYQNALQQDPRFGEARWKLAQAYEKNREVAKAAREYLRAADLLPENSEVQIKAGHILLYSGQYEDARARAEKTLQRDKGNVDAQLLRGNALAGSKDLDAGIRQVQEAIELDPNRMSSYLALGAMEQIKGQSAEAEQTFKMALTIEPSSIPAHLSLANFYLNQGDLPQTEATLLKAIALDPTHVMANRAVAILYIATRRVSKAEPHLKRVADVSKDSASRLMLANYYASVGRPADARVILTAISSEKADTEGARIRLAGLDYADGHKAEANRALTDILAKNPNSVPALLLKANFLTLEGHHDEALKVAQSVTSMDPDSASAHFLAGRIYLARHNVAEASREFKETLRINPRAAEAQLELSRLDLAAGRGESSTKLAEAAISNRPGDPRAHIMLARSLIVQGKLVDADARVKRLLAQLPGNSAVHTTAGMLAAANGDRVAAHRSYERALELDSADFDALAALTALDVRSGRAKEAAARVDHLLVEKPEQGRLLMLSAQAHAVLGDSRTTEARLRKAIAVDPNDIQAYSMLGTLYASMKRLDEAKKEFEAIVTRQPNDVTAHTIVAMILDVQKDDRAAQARYEKILAIEPEAAIAANNLAWLYTKTGQKPDMALQLARTASSKLPEHPSVNDTLGWIYYKQGLHELAVPPLEKSVRQDPANPTYQLHLGMAYAKIGQNEKAKSMLRQALSKAPSIAGADEARRVLETMTASSPGPR